MNEWFEHEIDWNSGPIGIQNVLDGFFHFEGDGLWKLTDANGNEINLTWHQKKHIEGWSQDTFVPTDNGKWKISLGQNRNGKNVFFTGKTKLIKTETSYKVVCYEFPTNVSFPPLYGIEMILLDDGSWKVHQYDNHHYPTEEETKARDEEYMSSKAYFRKLEESSRYDENPLSDGYSNDDDDEDNIMRGLSSGNGDQLGF